MFRPGDRLDHYRIERHLGTGGFGEVWLARESITDRPIALKFVSPGVASEDNIVRLERETALLARLDHPAIVTYAGRGYHQHLPYLATEFIQGPTLATLIVQGGRMDEVQVLRIAVQVAEGLGYAWDTAEIIHRDLKPENILVDVAHSDDQDGVRIKIIDLGLALGRRLFDAADADLEAEDREARRAERRIAAGTPMTMSPEQIQGGDLTVRSDMYALGVVMYHLLTGQPPFAGAQDDVVRAHLKLQPRDLVQVLPGIQPQTSAIVHRLLNKLPEGRYRDWAGCAASLRAVLHRLAPPRPVTARVSARIRPARPVSTPTGVSTATGDLPPVMPAPAAVIPVPAGMPAALPGVPVAPMMAAELAAAAARAPVPAVEDGLTPEQRAAVWSWLFRHPAVVAAAVQPAEPVHPGGPVVATPAHGQPRLPPAAGPGHPAVPAGGAPVPPPNAGGDPNPRPLSDLVPFLSTQPARPAAPVQAAPVPPAPGPAAPVAAVPASAAETAPEPTEASRELPADLVQMLVGAVHELVCGRVAAAPTAPEPLTRRFTARLRRLVAGREAAIEAIDEALRTGRLDQAARQLDDLASEAGNDGACALRRARLAALQQDPVMVLRWARSAVNQGVADPLALALLGLGHLLQGEPATAITVFTRLIAEHPGAVAGPGGLAAACCLAGRLPQADAALAAARGHAASPAFHRLDACRARLAGDTGAEEAILAQLLRETPDDAAAANRLRTLRRGEGSGNTRRHTAGSSRHATGSPETGALVRRPTDHGR
jgi:hypothetical protein